MCSSGGEGFVRFFVSSSAFLVLFFVSFVFIVFLWGLFFLFGFLFVFSFFVGNFFWVCVFFALSGVFFCFFGGVFRFFAFFGFPCFPLETLWCSVSILSKVELKKPRVSITVAHLSNQPNP